MAPSKEKWGNRPWTTLTLRTQRWATTTLFKDKVISKALKQTGTGIKPASSSVSRISAFCCPLVLEVWVSIWHQLTQWSSLTLIGTLRMTYRLRPELTELDRRNRCVCFSMSWPPMSTQVILSVCVDLQKVLGFISRSPCVFIVRWTSTALWRRAQWKKTL